MRLSTDRKVNGVFILTLTVVISCDDMKKKDNCTKNDFGYDPESRNCYHNCFYCHDTQQRDNALRKDQAINICSGGTFQSGSHMRRTHFTEILQ